MKDRTERPAGSPRVGEPAFLEIGKIRRPHGLTGEMLVELYTDFPERLVPGKEVFIGNNKDRKSIRSCRWHADGILLTLDGYTTPESVGKYRNWIIYVPGDEAPALPEGEYYYHELIDIEVFDESGQYLGKIIEIIETGANDVYVVVDEEGHELLLPAIPDVILSVDISRKMMMVHLLPGLRETDQGVP